LRMGIPQNSCRRNRTPWITLTPPGVRKKTLVIQGRSPPRPRTVYKE
jgi:hypothetical protein